MSQHRMARARMIAREAVNSGEFYDQPYWVFVLWVGMITNTDDGGLVRADCAWLRSRFLPRQRPIRAPSVSDVCSVVARWVSRGMLTSVDRKGVSYYRLTSFFTHNRIKSSGDEMRRDEMRRASAVDAHHSPMGCEADAAAADVGIEITEDPRTGVAERLMAEFGVGLRKAQEWADRFSGDDLDAWLRWKPSSSSARSPRAIRMTLMAAHTNPSELDGEQRESADDIARRVMGEDELK